MIKKRVSVELKKGINLIIVRPLWDYPITRGALVLHTGAYKDPEGKKGLSSVFSDLLNERSKLLEKMELYGAKIKSSASLTRSFVSFAFLNSNLKKSFALLSEFVADFTPDSGLLNVVKGKRIDKLSILEDDPEYIISRKLQEVVYKKSVLSNPVSGLKEDIENISLKDVESYYNHEFLESPIDIVIVSSVSWSRIRSMVENVVEKFTPKDIKIPSPPVGYTAEKILMRKKKLGNVFVTYFIPAWGVGTEEYLPLKLVSYVLGEGSFNSRLMRKLREDLALAYYVTSGVSRGFTIHGKRYTGYFEVAAEARMEAKERLIEELEKSIKSIVNYGITREEFELAKSYYIGMERKRGETYKDILDTILAERIYNLKENYFLGIRDEIKKVTMNDVKKVLLNLGEKDFSRIILEEEKSE